MKQVKWTMLLRLFIAATMLFATGAALAEYPTKALTFVVN